MRPSGTNLYRRLCPSVGPYVRYASAKTAFLGCFWPRQDPILKQMINQPTCSSICLSIHVTWSIHAETRPGRIFARSGLFFLFFDWQFVIWSIFYCFTALSCVVFSLVVFVWCTKFLVELPFFFWQLAFASDFHVTAPAFFITAPLPTRTRIG